MTTTRSIRARWIFPVDQSPIRDGVVEIVDDKIAAVRSYRSGETVEDLGDVAVLPGLVNAHTHLEFSRIPRPLGEPHMAFPDWIREVLAYRRAEEERTGDPAQWRLEGVSAGIAESKAAGVVAVGEIATSHWPQEIIGAAPLHFTVFAELLGLSAEQMEPLYEAGKKHVADGQLVECNWRPGLSPHAPYTVHPQLLARVCELSAVEHFPVAMHLAESLEEIEFLLSASGRMAEFLDSIQRFPRNAIPRGTRPMDYLQALATCERAIVVHGNFLADDEITFLGERSEQMSVAYCPRTSAYFLAGEYPLAKLLEANVNVCLGTDSRATNPDLSLFEEMRFVARRHPLVTPEGILYLGTQAGADALGIGDTFGSITPGKSAQLAVVTLTSTSSHDPHELLFAEGTSVRPLVPIVETP